MRRCFSTIAILCLFIHACLASDAFSWSVTYDFHTKKLKVAITERIEKIHPYLVWADFSAGEKGRFLSLVKDQGWIDGILPVQTEPMDLPALGDVELGDIPLQCPSGHKCFLFMVAVKNGHEPHEVEAWKEVSIFPLSIEAAKERLPGQNSFLPLHKRTEPNHLLQFSGSPSTSEGRAENDKRQPDIEKPDVFKIEGRKIFFANGRAERFQVIDWSDPAQPDIIASSEMAGTPREIYSINGSYIVLQTGKPKPPSFSSTTLVDVYAFQGNELRLEESLKIKGSFLESRRRGQLIYTITRANAGSDNSSVPPENVRSMIWPSQYELWVTAFEVTSQGKLMLMSQRRLDGIPDNAITAIFADYLVCAHFDYEGNNRSSLITIFDISNPDEPLPQPSLVKVPGSIPSEFHVDVMGDILRVVSSPASWRGDKGSMLSIFDLSYNPPKLVGRLDGIAPGEELYATRFQTDKAYVVTFERKDPLWVIDLSDPTNPKIMGHLQIPGWSEKLFIHDSKLLGIGVYDQPLPGEKEPGIWYQRVAVSLFDVEDPANPELLDRVVPLADKAEHTSSLALGDERALLLDWKKKLCAFPMQIYGNNYSNYVQIFTLGDHSLEDRGSVMLPVALQRVLLLDDNLLGGLGGLAFYTIDSLGKPEVLGSLELARDYAWVEYSEGMVWTAIRAWSHNLYKIYGFEPDDLNEHVRVFEPGSDFKNLKIDGHLALLYSLSPFRVSLLNLKTGEMSNNYVLDDSQSGDSYYDRIMLHENKIYAVQSQSVWPQQPVSTVRTAIFPPPETGYSLSIMKVWEVIDIDQKPKLLFETSVPGQLVGVTDQGKIIFQEAYEGDKSYLNIVSIEDGKAVLEKSKAFDCAAGPSSAELNGAGKLYMVCMPPEPYPIVIMGEAASDSALPKKHIPVVEPKLLSINSENLEVEATMALSRWAEIKGSCEDMVFLYKGYRYLPLDDRQPDLEISNQCAVYKLKGNSFEMVKGFGADVCNASDFALSDNTLFGAYGLKGLKSFNLF